nr:hypothetical protein [Tanacetum cinerariifolium]
MEMYKVISDTPFHGWKEVFLLFIDDKFEEWAWSCELTSFWPAAATVGIPAGFRSCASRSQTGASQSRQSTDCHKFDSWKNLTSYLPRACLMLALAEFPSSLRSKNLLVFRWEVVQVTMKV